MTGDAAHTAIHFESASLGLSDITRIGVECLKQKHPQVARSEIRAVKKTWIREHGRSKRRAQALLQWRMPGVAWTMDFTKPKQRMQGSNKRVLVASDLASGYTLAG